MPNVSFSLSVFLCSLEHFILFSLINDKLEQVVVVVKEKLLKGGLVFLRLLHNIIDDSEDFVVEDVVVLERLDEFDENFKKVLNFSD